MVLKVQKSEDNICMHSMSPENARFHVPVVLSFCPKHNLKPWTDVGKILGRIKEVQKGYLFKAKI